MASFGAVLRMVGRRSLGHWRLLLTLITGVVLSAGLMASVFLYSDAIRDLGLKHALEGQPALALDIHVRSSGKVTPGDYDSRKTSMDGLLAAYAGDITRETVHFGNSASFYLTPPGAPVPTADDRPRAHFQFVDELAKHTRVVEGRAAVMPTPAQPGESQHIEAVIGKASADALGITPGQTFELHATWRDDVGTVIVTVVGFLEPIDANEEYWAGEPDRFRVDTPRWPTYPFFLDEAALTHGLAPYLPSMDLSLNALAMVDRGHIDSTNADAVEGRLRALNSEVTAKIQYSRMETTIPDTISNYREKLFFTRLPLFVVMIQVVGIVLFYLVMVSTMVIERQTGEIALLKSRGASTGQVLTVFALEALGMCLFAVVAGPLIAVGAIALLGLTPPFFDLSSGELLRVPLSGGAVGLAALGALLAFFALVWPAYRACRYSITNYKQEISRPPTQPVFLRYYLDLVVMGIGAIAFYQLRQHGSFATESVFGGLSADPILLATPSLLILLTALVFLRLFPLTLRLVALLTKSLSGSTISVGLTRMVRSPVQHSRLILLLILTTAVGVFAAGFRATLDQGYEDRAAYQAGAEVRIQDVRKPEAAPLTDFNNAIAEATGSHDFTAIVRQQGSVNLERYQMASVTMLGIDPGRFPSIAAWRDDFAGPSLQELAQRLELSPAELATTPEIPAGTQSIGIWAQVPLGPREATLGVRVRDPEGRISEARLFNAEGPQAGPPTWKFYATGISVAPGSHVDSVFVRLPGQQPLVPQQITVAFDDLQVTDAAPPPRANWGPEGFPNPTVIEPFDDLSHYELIAGMSSVGSPGQFSRGTATEGRSGNVARLTFTRGPGGVTTAGIRRLTDQRALPIVTDSGFLDETKKKQGEEFLVFINSQYVKVKVVGTFKLFPTFDPAKGGHVAIADFAAFQDAGTRAPAGTSLFANEAWLGDRGGGLITRDSLEARGVVAQTVADRQVLLAEQAADPLIAASWQGILFMCFAAVLLLSALGFITHAALSAQARSLEFAILRTMGMSGRQIIGVVSFEQCFVIVAGVAAGTLLGFPLSRLMIDSMGISEHGTAALPPLIGRVGWSAIITVYTLLGIVVVTTVVALVALYSRLAVSRALRMGEL